VNQLINFEFVQEEKL